LRKKRDSSERVVPRNVNTIDKFFG
jgi:hypothetical protein